jgi:hypothetical protein
VTTPGFTAEASLRSARGPYRGAFLVLAAAEALRLAQGIPIYGNWCGPGHSGPGTPVDAVDEVCCRHDQCYCERGSLDCSCDRELIANMPGAIADSSTSAGGRVAGLAATAFFAVDPLCLCHRLCVPIFGCTSAPFPVPGIPGPLKLCRPPYV